MRISYCVCKLYKNKVTVTAYKTSTDVACRAAPLR